MNSIKNVFSRKKKEHPKFDELTSIDQGDLAQRSTDGPKYGLQLLYDGADAGHRDIDFVAVHGVGGHPLQSFTNAETGCCWIRDLLPLRFPHSRVFSYGYPADFLTKVHTSLSDQARELCWGLGNYDREQATTRQRIFICHSVGGLLVKRVLIEAYHHQQFIDVYKYTSGIVFLGTPHRGSSSASLALTLAKIVRVGPGALRVNQDLLREVQRNSEQVDEINQKFAHVIFKSQSLLIGSFYETYATKPFGIIAERSSAILNFPSEICISLDANHAQLSKFHGSNDINYERVLSLIVTLRKNALLADEPLNKSPASFSASQSQESLSQWIPCVASKKGTTSMGLLEMAGSMEQPKDYIDAELDIIAVHGLRGSPVRSWINRSPRTMWLRDMLQLDLSTSRVMSYGYRTEDVLRQNKFDLERLAEDLVSSVIDARAEIQDTSRPLVFIGYSFGGLLVKKALLRLRENEQLDSKMRELLQAVISVIFLGVPHDVDDPSFAHRWTGIVQCTTGIKRIEIFNAAESIDEIRHISAEFRRLETLEVCSIAESEPTRVSPTQEKSVLVSAKSSRLGWAERETIFLAKGKSHLELPMFVDTDDPSYVCIRDSVSRSLDRHGREVGRRESEQLLRALWQVDYEERLSSIPEPHEGTCEWIFHTEPMESWLAEPRGILLVQGSPGSGKSVLAKHLVRRMPEALQPRATVVLYYFVSYAFSRNTCENLMASFLHQLFKESGSRLKYAIKQFRTRGVEFVGSLDVLTKVFSDAVSQERGTNFVAIIDEFDALNRGERQSLVELLSRLEENPNLGCIVTSRDTSDFHNLAEGQSVTLSLSAEDSRHDIEKYVSDSFGILLDGQTSAELQAVQNFVLEHAAGSFLWTCLAVRGISELGIKGLPLSQIDSLDWLPREMGLFYDNLVAKIEDSGTRDGISELRQILSILAVQRESMHLSVLAEALQRLPPQLLSQERRNDIDDEYMHRVEPMTSVPSALAPLVSINNDYVTLAHVSVKEYILHTGLDRQSSLIPIHSDQANADLARRCVAVIYRNLTAKAQPGDMEKIGHSFTGYAAKNWMVHFHDGQELVDEEMTELATGLFRTDESPLSRWLTLYEQVTAEELPRRDIFGPLFGGAYFGLTPIVKKVLKVGCDINATDSDAKTPLHWACERGHLDVAALLIHNGANISGQCFDGRTCLHLAVQNNHVPLVKQLLALGVNPNAAAFDGRTALHLAVEANNTEIAQILLDAGADATERATSGFNAFQLASQLTTQSALRILMNSAAAPEKLLSKAITENTPDMVALLITHRLDVIERQYPWVAELVDEGLSSKEISSLLLQSENLQWIQSEEWPPQSKRTWNDLPTLTHQRGCAHQLVHAVFESSDPSSSGQVTEEQNEPPPNSEINSGHRSADGSREVLTDALLEPLEFFTRLEQREQKLLQSCGIGGVFPPWYAAPNPGSAMLLAGQAKIMYGEPDSAQIFFPISTTPHPHALQIEAASRAQADPSDDADRNQSDVSSYVDSASIFSIQTDSSYDSTSRANDYEIWDQRIGRRILDALENVLNAFNLLRNDGGCCESFTILVKASSRHRTVTVKKIAVSLLLELCEALDQSILASDTNSSIWTQPLTKACTGFLEELGCGEMVHKYVHSSLGSAVSPHRCFHLCALITQMAAIGIVTYSRGHSREFYTPALSRPIDSFVLLGSEPAGPTFHAERLELECMGKMLGRKVWVFHQDKHLIENTAETFYLATSVGDMLDTWGGCISLEDVADPAGLFLSIGGGSIVTVESNDGRFDMAQDDEICCHWAPKLGLSLHSQELDKADRRLLIGATSVNEHCLLKTEVCQEAFSGGALTSMGTRAPGWKTTGRAANLSIGFHGATAGVAGTQTKDDGRSLKVKIFQD